MKILVTGATGFIGSHLVRHLAARGHSVVALARRRMETPLWDGASDALSVRAVSSDGRELFDILKTEKPDVVVHLASLFLSAHTAEHIEPLVTSNVLFGTRLLEAMKDAGVTRLVNTGTSWEHMDGAKDYRPVCLYAATKRAFEDILRFYEDAHGLRAVTLKLFDTYGPHDKRPKLFALLKKAVASQEPLAFSPGRQTLDLAFVEDVARAFEKAVAHVMRKRRAKPENIFIGSGKAVPLRSVAELYAECAGKPLSIAWGARPYRDREVMRAKAPLGPAKRVLQWEPRTDLKSGIKRLLRESGN